MKPIEYKQRIVFIDDENDLEFLLTIAFEKQPFVWSYFQSAKEALSFLEVQNDVGVVIADIQMPDMSGHLLLKQLHEQHPQIITMIMSAYGDMINIRQAMNQGAFDFLIKPIEILQLPKILEKALTEARKRQTLYHVATINNSLLKQALEIVQTGMKAQLLLEEQLLQIKTHERPNSTT